MTEFADRLLALILSIKLFKTLLKPKQNYQYGSGHPGTHV